MSRYTENYYYEVYAEEPDSASGSHCYDFSPSSQGSAWPTSSSSRLISPPLSAPLPVASYALSDAGTPDPGYGAEYSTSQPQSQSPYYCIDEPQSPYYYTDDGYSRNSASPANEYPSTSKQATDDPGHVCRFPGCSSKPFKRNADLDRHYKQRHLPVDAKETTDNPGHVCCFPGCSSKPFKRNADLDRHYKQRHLPDDAKETYHCDYSKCPRKESQPFHRKDHFRDHLREYHNEDLGKRGRSASEKSMDNKSVKKDWWRCTRCLGRVYIGKNQFECPSCKTSCDSARIKLRRSLGP